MVTHDPAPLRGLRVLIVEDEYIVALDMAQSIEESGATVVGPVRSVASALAILEAEPELDLAVLDINLGSEKVYPVADAMRTRGLPFVFATGYDQAAIPSTYWEVPRFEKPVDLQVLARMLPR